MQKFGSVLSMIMGIVLAGVCIYAIVRGLVTPVVIVGLVAGVIVFALGILFMIRASKKTLDEDDEIED